MSTPTTTDVTNSTTSSSTPKKITCLPSILVTSNNNEIGISISNQAFLFDISHNNKNVIKYSLDNNVNIKSMVHLPINIHDQNEYLTVLAGNEDKTIYIYYKAQLIGKILLGKKLNCMTIHPMNKELFIGDKFGDVYSIDLIKEFLDEFKLNNTDIKIFNNKTNTLRLGHLSMLTGLLLTNNNKIISSDRDEKIRVSYYPDSYRIYNFCLGHEEMISTIELLNDELLISGSTDKTIKVWRYLDDTEPLVYSLTVEDYPHVIKTIELNGHLLVLVGFEGKSYLKMYEWIVESNELKEVVLSSQEKQSLEINKKEEEILNFVCLKESEMKMKIYMVTTDATFFNVEGLEVEYHAGSNDFTCKTIEVPFVVGNKDVIPTFTKDDLSIETIYSSLIRKIDKYNEEQGERKERQQEAKEKPEKKEKKKRKKNNKKQKNENENK
ncbi:hypothetical protein ABK040_012283 [Willaertia magna]